MLDASISRGSRMREPVTLTPKTLAILDKHEPVNAKQAELLTDHLT